MTDEAANTLTFPGEVEFGTFYLLFANSDPSYALQMSWNDQGKDVHFYTSGQELFAFCADNSTNTHYTETYVYFNMDSEATTSGYGLCTTVYGDWYIDW